MARRGYRQYGTGRPTGGIPSFEGCVWQLRRWRPQTNVSRGAQIQMRGGGCADEAYRGISRQLRPLDCGTHIFVATQTLHLRTLAYTKGEIRQDTGIAAYQPGGGRTTGMA